MSEAEESAAKDRRLVLDLRALASSLTQAGNGAGADAVLSAAAHIEGHNEAFRTVVAEKRDLQAQLRHMQTNLDFRNQFIGCWRDLLVALQVEHPADVRLQRALAGEHPMRPTPWEKRNRGK